MTAATASGLRKAKRAESDRTIAATVHTLIGWGFSLRRGSERIDGAAGVAELVGQRALIVLKRPSAVGGALGERQVKVLYERWLGSPNARAARSQSRYQVKWRRRFLPDKAMSLIERIDKLLLHDGRWPEDETTIRGWGDVVVLITRNSWIDGPHFPTSLDVDGDAPRTGSVLASGWRLRPKW